MTITYPITAEIKISYILDEGGGQEATQEYVVLSHTLTSETAKKVFDMVNSTDRKSVV